MYRRRTKPILLPLSPDWDIGRRVFELAEPIQQQHPSLQGAFALIGSDDGDMINVGRVDDDKDCGLFDRE